MYQRIPIFVALLFILGILQGQSLKTNSDISPNISNSFEWEKINPKELHADFLAQDRFGESPFSVFFKDISIGNPTSWLWDFGDETTDTLQYPTHVFQLSGNYTIKLTVSDGTSTSTVKKVDYIRVVEQGGCDSLNFPLPGDYTIYPIIDNGSGYVSGNNSYGDLAKASFFDENEEGMELTASLFHFALAKKSLTNDIPVFFKVWKNDGNNGTPGTTLDSLSLPISQLILDVEAERPTLIFFNEPVALDGPFYLGVELPQIYGDTLVLFTNTDDDVPEGNSWNQDSLTTWYSYSDIQSLWNLQIDHAIFPIVCQSTGVGDLPVNDHVLIFPNPASDNFFLYSLDSEPKHAQVSIFDLSGKMVSNQQQMGYLPLKVDIASLHEGLYLVRVVMDKSVINRKILIERN